MIKLRTKRPGNPHTKTTLESKHPLYDLSKVDVFVQNPMEEVHYSTGVRTPAVSPYIST